MMIRIASIALLVCVACDDETSPGTTDATTTTTATTTDVTDQDGRPDFEIGNSIITDPSIETEDLGAGVTRGRVDATREEGWVQVALAGGAQVTTEGGWDVAFQRIQIRVNHPIAAVDQAFDTVTQAPAEGYVTDGATPEEYAFAQLGEWWEYDLQSHTVSPKVKTFILKIDDETYYKLAVRDYYDDAGTTGLVTLDWATVGKP